MTPMPCRDGRTDATYSARDGTCDWCGSLNPDVLMARLEEGDVELVPTDKSYKVYVRNRGGERFRQAWRDCPRGEPPHMPADCAHWVVEEREEAKFYFEHLTPEQQERFVRLLNERRLHLGYPGFFYSVPFFARGRVAG